MFREQGREGIYRKAAKCSSTHQVNPVPETLKTRAYTLRALKPVRNPDLARYSLKGRNPKRQRPKLKETKTLAKPYRVIRAFGNSRPYTRESEISSPKT